MSLLLRGGRVIDPATARDEVADVLLEGGTVTQVGHGLQADTELDVTGMVVGPGFIDMHSHVHSIAGHRLQAFDGVTTALDLEAGLMPLSKAYATAAEQGRPLNYGFSASWAGARAAVHAGIDPGGSIEGGLSVLGNPEWLRTSTPGELDRWLDLLNGELAAGGLGIGILLGYAPETEPAEMVAVARLAATAGVPTFTHVRELIECDPSTAFDGPTEITVLAAETGARMHHCHVNSTSRRHIDRVLSTLANAQAAGSPVTVEAYPYGAGSTGIGAYFLAPERLHVWDLRPTSIVVAETGERVASEDRLRELRATQPGLAVIVEYLDEAVEADRLLVQKSLAFPDAIVASDAMPIAFRDGTMDTREWPLPPGGSTHPRIAGTFTKALRAMVGSGQWSWVEAFRRCSYLPSQVLSFSKDMHGKGRLAPGCDADLVVLDPEALADNATYAEPTLTSSGVRHLFVGGQAVITHGRLDTDAFPGRPIRNDH
jgi:cytosine/adenosine deaminase-related metal-dependent hydrolase